MSEITTKRRFEYTLQVIADAAGHSVNVVREHKQRAYFNPEDAVSVAEYIMAFRVINRMIKDWQERQAREAEDSPWGGSDGKKGGGS